MLNNFPPAFPDETLYSVLCRWRRILGIKEAYKFERRLGKYSRDADPNFPVGLSLLEQKTDPEWLHAEEKILHHTILPYYRFFNPAEFYTNWRRKAYIDPKALYRSMGMFSAPRQFKFCPLCAANDIRSKRPPYFRRFHQLLGAEACFIHGVRLAAIDFEIRKLLPFVPLAEELTRYEAASAQSAHPILILLAKDLADVPKVFPQRNCEDFFKLFLRCAQAAGIECKVVGWGRAVKSYLKDAGSALPVHLHRRLMPPLGTTIMNVVQPARALVLIRAYGLTPEMVANYSPGPAIEKRWCCLNRLCRLYKTKAMTLVRSFKLKPKRYFIVKCPNCGLVRVQGRTKDRTWMFTTSVLDFGEQWNEKLRSLWLDEKVSAHRLANQLGLSRNALCSPAYHGAFLNGLPADRAGRRSSPMALAHYRRLKHKDKVARMARRLYCSGSAS